LRVTKPLGTERGSLLKLVASQLHETSALDSWVLARVPLTMLAVTLLASYMPARRAARIEVCAALRENQAQPAARATNRDETTVLYRDARLNRLRSEATPW
jgi:hypothetical protein